MQITSLHGIGTTHGQSAGLRGLAWNHGPEVTMWEVVGMINVDWLGFSIASAALVLAPGPGSLFVAKSAATGHARAGLMAMLGIVVGDACLILLSLLGVSALFLAQPVLFHVIRLAGAGYLIFLGLQWIFSRPREELHMGRSQSLPFRRAVSIALLNPKSVFFTHYDGITLFQKS